LVFVFAVSLLSASTNLGFNAGKDPGLVGWWKLDDGAGMTATDHPATAIMAPPVGASTFVSP